MIKYWNSGYWDQRQILKCSAYQRDAPTIGWDLRFVSRNLEVLLFYQFMYPETFEITLGCGMFVEAKRRSRYRGKPCQMIKTFMFSIKLSIEIFDYYL